MLLPIKITSYLFYEKERIVMRRISKEELKNVLEDHQVWLRTNKKDGKRADLIHVDLSGANLTGADLTKADLTYSNLTDANLSGANLTKADLTYSNLKYADLSWADLTKANLVHANLVHANLNQANLECVCLYKADLSGAYLYEANLADADLQYANLSEANLKRTNLSEVDLEHVELHCAVLPKQIIQIGPIGKRKSYTVINLDDDIITCGCWKGNFKEFKDRINETYPDDGKYRTQYLGVIKLIETLKTK